MPSAFLAQQQQRALTARRPALRQRQWGSRRASAGRRGGWLEGMRDRRGGGGRGRSLIGYWVAGKHGGRGRLEAGVGGRAGGSRMRRSRTGMLRQH